jgi:hypothetical protein
LAARADQLNSYFYAGGGPELLCGGVWRVYTSLSASDVQAPSRNGLPSERRVELIVNPEVEAMTRRGRLPASGCPASGVDHKPGSLRSASSCS